MSSFNIANRMNICLKTQARQAAQQVTLIIQERLPSHIESVGPLTCKYQIELADNYYLLTLHVRGVLDIICQRCANVFRHDYDNETKLAVCANDAIAERLMEHFECIVACDNQIDLTEVVTDDLHLFSPEKHADKC